MNQCFRTEMAQRLTLRLAKGGWLGVLICVLLVSGCARADRPTPIGEWVKVTSKNGKFTGMFPAKPKTTEVEGGEQFILETDRGASAYLLQWMPLAEKLDIEDDAIVAQFFDLTQAAMVEALPGSKLLKEDDSEEGHLRVRTFDVSTPEYGVFHAQLKLDREYLYQVILLGKKSFIEGENAKVFIRSAKVVGDKASATAKSSEAPATETSGAEKK